MSTTVVIIGANGFLGRYLCRHFARNGREVVAIADKELGTDDAVPAQGAEEITWEQADAITLSAEDILQDPETAEMWMRSVQQDPSNFLAIKFGMQLLRQDDGEEAKQ